MANHSYYQKLLSEREQELAERNEELEAQHEELTAAIEALIDKNQHLEDTLKELHTRNQEIDQIVYKTSHDLKTPISSLEGIFTLMKMDKEVSLEEYLEMAFRSTEDMKRMLLMLVRYSNNLVIDVGHSAIDFDKLWAQLNQDIKTIDGHDEVKLKFSKRVNQLFEGDPERIRLVLFNLIKNGIDFRKAGAKMRLEIKINQKTNGDIKMLVSDNGVGIPQAIQKDVFEMFYRGLNRSHGSGLGLYLCKRNVELMKGKIHLMSSENIGTTITVELPNKKRKP